MFEIVKKFIPEQYSGYSFLGNSTEEYLTAVIAFVAFLVIFKVFQALIIAKLNKLAKKTKTDLDDTFIKIVRTLRPPFYSFIAFFFALNFLETSAIFKKVIDTILIVWIVYQVTYAFGILIDYAVKKKVGLGNEDDAKGAINFLSFFSKIILWSLGLLFILSNLGVNITSLIAGLGIGGIAIAFALQNVLSDLFSSFAIAFDKPFVPGDFIIVGDKMGIVKKTGVKTTRIQALQGEEIIVSNAELTSAKIQNFKKMKERRINFSIGVTYDTTTEKLKKIPEIIKGSVEKVTGARFDRAHFHKFGDFAYVFDVVYYVTNGDYNQYMDINQDINMGIKGHFEKEKIDFAYPTQTIHIEK